MLFHIDVFEEILISIENTMRDSMISICSYVNGSDKVKDAFQLVTCETPILGNKVSFRRSTGSRHIHICEVLVYGEFFSNNIQGR